MDIKTDLPWMLTEYPERNLGVSWPEPEKRSREASTGGNKQNHVLGKPQKRNITSVVTPKKGNYFLIKAIEPHS